MAKKAKIQRKRKKTLKKRSSTSPAFATIQPPEFSPRCRAALGACLFDLNPRFTTGMDLTREGEAGMMNRSNSGDICQDWRLKMLLSNAFSSFAKKLQRNDAVIPE